MHVLTQKRFEGLEEDKIAGYSNGQCAGAARSGGLEEDKIAGYSNFEFRYRQPLKGLEEDEITWYSNTCYTFQPEHTWKRKKLQNFQTRM